MIVTTDDDLQGEWEHALSLSLGTDRDEPEEFFHTMNLLAKESENERCYNDIRAVRHWEKHQPEKS